MSLEEKPLVDVGGMFTKTGSAEGAGGKPNLVYVSWEDRPFRDRTFSVNATLLVFGDFTPEEFFRYDSVVYETGICREIESVQYEEAGEDTVLNPLTTSMASYRAFGAGIAPKMFADSEDKIVFDDMIFAFGNASYYSVNDGPVIVNPKIET